jgi:hypothetical protein
LIGVAGLGIGTLGIGGAANAGMANDDHKVGVCHATGSDTNPYVFIVVDRNSTAHRGHLMHRDDPNKTNPDGTDRPDLIDGLDGSIKSLADCVAPAPTPSPSDS